MSKDLKCRVCGTSIIFEDEHLCNNCYSKKEPHADPTPSPSAVLLENVIAKAAAIRQLIIAQYWDGSRKDAIYSRAGQIMDDVRELRKLLPPEQRANQEQNQA